MGWTSRNAKLVILIANLALLCEPLDLAAQRLNLTGAHMWMNSFYVEGKLHRLYRAAMMRNMKAAK